MNKAKGNWRQLQQLWPMAVAVLAACGGASDPAEDTAKADDTVAATTNERAEARRRSTWVYCAAEGATCAVPSQRVVRYGVSGAYMYKTISGSIACNNSMWGDPAVGRAKTCDYAASTSAVAPAPAPAPVPAPAPAPAPSATLQWDPRVGAASYRLYYGTASRTYSQALGEGLAVGAANTSYAVNNLTAGRSYYFAVTAVDANGNESVFSNEAVKLVQ
jgi:hypothetical protein